MSRYIGSYSPTASALTYQAISTTTTVTSTSSTFAVMSGSSLTVLQTGTYKVEACCNLSVNASGTSNKAETEIFIDGVAQPNTRQQIGTEFSGLSLASVGWNLTTSAFFIVNLQAGNVVDFRFRRSNGSATITAAARSLMITRVG